MPVKLTGDTEIGITTTNLEAMIAFYRDTLGLPFIGELEFFDGVMHRFQCGGTVVKLVKFNEPPVAKAAGSSHKDAAGFRYLSLAVGNLTEIVTECRNAGYVIPVDVTPFTNEIGFAFLQDPDGNRIELFGQL